MTFRVAAAWPPVLAAILLIPFVAWPQQPETLTIYTDHPRLFLRPNRLRLLKRERERKSLRWDQFDLLMAGKAPMPEQGFASALYYRVTESPDAAKRAMAFALGPSTDLHQLALIYDWCQDVLSESDNRTLAAKLERQMAALRNDHSIPAERSRLLAAIALAGHLPAVSSSVITAFMEDIWPRQMVPVMRQGHPISRDDTFALLEIFHAVRDNLNVDLRESYPAYFKSLPIYHLLSHYPPPWPAAENQYRIPAVKDMKEPDLTRAALSRAAELAMVAYDANAPESQVLQGWLMNDQFLLRGTFGITYELLWANPYQPGLSYYHVPLVFHDDIFGRLFVRSSWEDNAEWLGFFDGQLQHFSEGKITVLNPSLTREPLDLDEALVFFGREVHKFKIPNRVSEHPTDKEPLRSSTPAVEGFDVFIVGLDPRRLYHVEIDDEEMTEVRADPGGILYFRNVPGPVGVRLAPSPREALQQGNPGLNKPGPL